MPNLRSLKMYRKDCILFAELSGRLKRTLPLGHYHESSDCFECQKKSPYLNQATYIKKVPVKFSYPKKIPESKLSNPKKSFDHPRHLKSRVTPSPTPWDSNRETFRETMLPRLRGPLQLQLTSIAFYGAPLCLTLPRQVFVFLVCSLALVFSQFSTT